MNVTAGQMSESIVQQIEAEQIIWVVRTASGKLPILPEPKIGATAILPALNRPQFADSWKIAAGWTLEQMALPDAIRLAAENNCDALCVILVGEGDWLTYWID